MAVAVAMSAAALCALPGAASAELVSTGHNPRGLPAPSCFWTGPFTDKNPDTNYAYPGTEIRYWGAKFITPPGAKLFLRGRYAHARYESLNAYQSDGEAVLESAASTGSLPDYKIKPDAGSTNPFILGHRRDGAKRAFTVRVEGSAPSGKPPRNTLYALREPDSYQDVILRIYVPDKGYGDEAGGGLPKPELRLAGGEVLRGQELCNALNSNHDYRPQLIPQVLQNSLVNWPGKDPATNPAQNPLFFEKFFNLNYALAQFKTPAELAATDATPQGTQYNNGDVKYMVGQFDFAFGDVLAVRGRMPSTPKTFKGGEVMGGGQLRLWDMCVIESLVTTRNTGCLYDEQIPLLKRNGRRYVLAVTRAENRPTNARKKCGVAWLESGPNGDGSGRPLHGALLTRNLLPDSRFHHSAWDVDAPNTAAEVMADNYPRGSYMSKAQFESYGCPFDWLNGPHG
ncbi:MAG: hypothetical protein EXQ70_06680 [Solirubrobacterales bacterium]|nr:hypothetical protein [Solirubrobacterales bacterium]